MQNDPWEIIQNNCIEILVNKEERNKRVKICKTCEQLSNIQICNQCNCFMPIKTWLKISKCPKEKW